MKPVLTPEQATELDRVTQDRGVSAAELMERAGRAVARSAVDLLGGAYGRRAVAVCGKGNNGGDGLVAARYLARRGMRVTALLLAPAEGYGAPSATNLARARAAGVDVREATERLLDREAHRADVALDAIVGTGFRGEARGRVAEAIAALEATATPVVAVDIPSGVDGETGAVAGPAVEAAVTVALGSLKPGHILYPGAAHAGSLEVADIGFPPDLVSSDLWLVEP